MRRLIRVMTVSAGLLVTALVFAAPEGTASGGGSQPLGGQEIPARLRPAAQRYEAALAKAKSDFARTVRQAEAAYLKELDQALGGAMAARDAEAVKSLQEVKVQAQGASRRRWRLVSIEIPADAVLFQGHYYKLYTDRLNWNQAEARCLELGGHLACIESDVENAFLKEFKGEHGVWIGASDETTPGEWKWVNGAPFKYTNWNPGEPSESEPPEHWLSWAAGHAGWNNWLNGQGEFICEWD